MQQILCVAFSQTHEWDSQNVIMTGSTDGVARVSIISLALTLKECFVQIQKKCYTSIDVVYGLRTSARGRGETGRSCPC